MLTLHRLLLTAWLIAMTTFAVYTLTRMGVL